MKTGIIIIACIICCSCAVLHPQSEWTDHCPTDPQSPWQRTVDVAFSNAPLPQVVSRLQELANAQSGPKLSLGLGTLPSGPWGQSTSLITFNATNVPVAEAFRIIGDVANYWAMFRGHEGILAEHCHGHRKVTLFLSGRCLDAATGEPIKSLSISREFDVIGVEPSGQYLHPVTVEGTTDFVRCDGNNYMMKTEIFPQDIRFVVTSPGYQPQEFVISTRGSQLAYTNNIEMIKHIPTKP